MSAKGMMSPMHGISRGLVFSLGLLACPPRSAERKPTEPLKAIIEVPAGQTDAAGFMVLLRITNQTDHRVVVLNPDMGIPSPAMKWPHSTEAYQTSLLISFHYLSMSVIDMMGQELPQQAIQTWATPVLRPKLEMAPGDSFELAIPIGNFYQLASGKPFLVALEYGDQNLKVTAQSPVTVP